MVFFRTSILVFLSFLSGCANANIGHFSVISTEDIPLADLANYQKTEIEVTGIDKEHIFIFIPTGIPEFDKVVKNALSKNPDAVALSDAQVKYKFWYIPYVYGQEYYEITGKLVTKKQ